MPGGGFRRWTVTVNDYDFESDPDGRNLATELPVGVEYMVWQKESAPSTGQLHIQGYIRFDSAVSMGRVKGVFGPGAHCEPSRGSEKSNEEYCSKEGRLAGPFTLGSPAKPGRRTDLEALTAAVAGGTFKAEDFQVEVVKYGAGISRLISALDKPCMREKVDVLVIVGPTDIGKTQFVYDMCSVQNEVPYRFEMASTTSHCQFWPGYDGEKTLFIDEFKGSEITATQMQLILDKFPYRVRCSTNEYRWAKWIRVVITTNVPVQDWYDGHTDRVRASIRRRITKDVTCGTREDLTKLWAGPPHPRWKPETSALGAAMAASGASVHGDGSADTIVID